MIGSANLVMEYAPYEVMCRVGEHEDYFLKEWEGVVKGEAYPVRRRLIETKIQTIYWILYFSELLLKGNEFSSDI